MHNQERQIREELKNLSDKEKEEIKKILEPYMNEPQSIQRIEDKDER